MPSPKLVALAALILAGCAARLTPVAEEAAPGLAPVAAIADVSASGIPNDWRTVATPADRDRVERVAEVWAPALAQARRRFSAEIEREGPLLEADAALLRPAPPPGSYRCRMVKLGGTIGYRAFPPYFCYVEAEDALLILDKQTGSERPAGRVWDDDDRQLVFLGAMELGDEAEPPAYGARPERDLAGVVQRVAPFRWRLVVPATRPGASLDVLELVPAPSAIRNESEPS